MLGFINDCANLLTFKARQVNLAFEMWMGTHFKYAVLVRTNCVPCISAYLSYQTDEQRKNTANQYTA